MFARLALLFILVPLIELALLIRVGQWVGLWPTLGLVVTTGILGAALARAEGLRTLVGFQKEVAEGRLPGQRILDGLAILIGGAFLLTPGLLTDVAGFCLLFPLTRRGLQRWLRGRIQHGIDSGAVQFRVWPAGFPGREGAAPDLDPTKEVGGGDGGPGA